MPAGSSTDRPELDRPVLASHIVTRIRRDAPLALVDASVVLGSYLVTLVLRFDGRVPDRYWQTFWTLSPLIVALFLAANLAFGLYGQMWRYASAREARRVVLASVAAGSVVAAIGAWPGWPERLLPASVLILGAALALLGSGAVRFQSRLFGFRRRAVEGTRTRVLVAGAGEAGQSVLRDILRNEKLGLEAVGLVDDDRRKVGRAIHGVQVLGPLSMIPGLARARRADQVLLAIPSAPARAVREVAVLCEGAGLGLRVLPSVREIVNGHVGADDARELQIEDLLGRDQVATDLEAVRGIVAGRRILITGAGGSIGSEIARQVARLDPAALILVDHDETHLHDVLMDVEGPAVHPVLLDVREEREVLDAFTEHRPQVVFHAAAHKHVPLLEAHPREALMTNVLGTGNLADAAVASGTERFVLISTDKAVRPASVMGASKRLAEEIVRSRLGGPIFCAVRFGNVMGSRGSVVPTFVRQIARGGPVTVTDPAMSRYFMSVHEAVQLVLQAAALSGGGEIFTLDMGEPTVIIDLARDMIRLSGKIPDRDVAVAVTGVRPGEKLTEQLAEDGDGSQAAGHPSIVVSRPPVPDPDAVRSAIDELEVLGREGRTEELAARLKELARGPNGSPSENRAEVEAWTRSDS